MVWHAKRGLIYAVISVALLWFGLFYSGVKLTWWESALGTIFLFAVMFVFGGEDWKKPEKTS